VQKHFPQAPELAPGAVLYALHAADGTPIMLTDSREAAIANAWSKRARDAERALSSFFNTLARPRESGTQGQELDARLRGHERGG